jgi:AcrR family transcriptional regulator
VSTQSGLRERKKQQTRQLIADTALRLFTERGFDTVTVAQVAREADVSEGTVFNYFPTKEDLFFSQMQSFEAALVDAVRTRAAGESVLRAFERFVDERSERLARDDAAPVITTAARLMSASPALQARERQIVAEATEALAAVIAEQTGASVHDLEPLVVAHALMGVQRSLVIQVRAEVLAGRRGRRFAADMRSRARHAFARLEHGLGGYAVKPGSVQE